MLVIIITLLIIVIPSQTYGDLASFIDKGDKIVYEVIYYGDNNGSSTDYYEVNVLDKYFSTDLYFSLEVTYNGIYGSLSKKYETIKTFDLPTYIPAVLNIEETLMLEDAPMVLSVPVPVKDWNTLMDRSSPIAGKTLSLKFQYKQLYELCIGDTIIPIYVYVLKGSDPSYSYTAYVDNGTGILIELDIYSNQGHLLFAIKLIYYNKFLTNTLPVSSSEPNSNNTLSGIDSNEKIPRIIFTIVLATISIFALLIISSRFSK